MPRFVEMRSDWRLWEDNKVRFGRMPKPARYKRALPEPKSHLPPFPLAAKILGCFKRRNGEQKPIRTLLRTNVTSKLSVGCCGPGFSRRNSRVSIAAA